MSLTIGARLDGKYEIKRLLGEGGMGAVYEGENALIHRKVAIKVLHSGVAALEEAVMRFEREAQAAGRIGSEHIVEVLDLGRLESGDRYMVMEFLEGESLSSRIQARGKLAATEICRIGLQLLEGLGAAHDAGIIHRDLKPDNVWLSSRVKGRPDFIKILDFGISKFSALGNEFRMTRTGSVMGTPYYMAPEQARGAKNLDARLDVYAAGVILYEAATGRVPFDGDTFNELLFKIVTEETPPVRTLAPELDAGLASIIDKARQKDPAQRFQSAREFQSALQTWQEAPKDQASVSALAQTFATAPIIPTLPLAAAAAPPSSALGAPPNSALGAPPSSALGSHTHQAWANTGLAAPAPEPARRNRIAIGAVAGALLLGGVGMVLKLQQDTAHSAASAAATSLSVERQLTEAREDAARKLAEEQARTRALEVRAEQSRAEAESARLSASQDKAAAEEERRRADEAKLQTQQRLDAAAAARARSAKKSATRTPSQSGRKIRTSL